MITDHAMRVLSDAANASPIAAFVQASDRSRADLVRLLREAQRHLGRASAILESRELQTAVSRGVTAEAQAFIAKVDKALAP